MYLQLCKKIFGIVFASGETSNEGPEWSLGITRVIAVYRNVPK